MIQNYQWNKKKHYIHSENVWYGARLSLQINQPKKINWILHQIQQKSYA